MSLSEQELRERLAASADDVSAPSFAIDGLIGRVRRRRAIIAVTVSGALLAVAAIAVAIPVALIGPSAPMTGHPAEAPFTLSYAVTVNGQSRIAQKDDPPPSFPVAPGEALKIEVSVIVPAHAHVTSLWLGIAKGAFGPGTGEQRPVGVQPILEHVSKTLGPGRHAFNLSWTVPAGLDSGTILQLAATWTATQEQTRVGNTAADLTIKK